MNALWMSWPNITTLDLELYEYAVNLFEKRLEDAGIEAATRAS